VYVPVAQSAPHIRNKIRVSLWLNYSGKLI
jgi:hypothetical protein